MSAFDDAWDFMKAMKPHRQKVLPEGADSHMRLQQWANRHPTTKEAFTSGGDEARTAHRDNLMREAVADPSAHGLSFVGGEPIPFDEEERQSTLEEFTKMVNTRSSGGPRQPASFRRRMKNPTTTAGAPAETPQTQEPQGQFLQQQAMRADKGRATDMEKLKRTDPEAYQKLLLEQQYAPDQRLNDTRLLDFVGKMDVHKQVMPRGYGSLTPALRRIRGKDPSQEPYVPQQGVPPHQKPMQQQGGPSPYNPKPAGPTPEAFADMKTCKRCGKQFNMKSLNPMQRYQFSGMCPECSQDGGMPQRPGPPGTPPYTPYPEPLGRGQEVQHPQAPSPYPMPDDWRRGGQVRVTPGTMYK